MMEATGLVADDGSTLRLRLGAGQLVLLSGGRRGGTGALLAAWGGLQALRQGELRLDGRRIDGLPPHERRRRGISFVPEQPPVLPGLSVRDNLRVAGCHLGLVRLRQAMAQADDWFPELQACARQPAGTLSGGQQRLLGLAQGLMGPPRLLLLDQPTQALAPPRVQRLLQLLGALRAQGLAVLVADAQAGPWRSVADAEVSLDG